MLGNPVKNKKNVNCLQVEELHLNQIVFKIMCVSLFPESNLKYYFFFKDRV